MICEQCDAYIVIPKDTVIGEIVSCPDCGVVWESVKGGFEVAEQIGEDWGQ